MEKNRNVKIYVIFALVISVMGLSIAYAAYSATLLISGTVTAKKSSEAWNVHFESPDGGTTLTPSLEGYAEVVSPANVTATTISGFKVNFYAPGDSIEYSFDIKNTGSIDATIDKIALGSLSCSASGNEQEAQKLCNNLDMAITNSNGDEISLGDKIPAESSESYFLLIFWSSIDTATYNSDIEISVGEIKFEFVQD